MLMSYMPEYIHVRYNRDLQGSAAAAVIPYACRIVTLCSSGSIADHLSRNGVPLIRVRKAMNTLSLVGPAVCVVVLTLDSVTEEQAVVLLSASVAFTGLSVAGST